MRRVGPLGQDETNGKDDVTVEALRFPAWVPKLTEPTEQTGSGTYISIHDYNLLIARADERNTANMAMTGIAGLLLGWMLVKAYRR